MEPYSYALGAEAVHAFTKLKPKRREQVLRIFDALAEELVC
jgi:hypothetical protein